jgi:hypothetical protein
MQSAARAADRPCDTSILGVKPRPLQARSHVFGLLAILMGSDSTYGWSRPACSKVGTVQTDL